MRTRRLIIAAVAVTVLPLSGCAEDDERVAVGQESPVTETTARSEWKPVTDPTEIVAIAHRAAERSGDPEPTEIEWVFSTRAAAVELTSGSLLADADGPALLIQMRGTFDTDSVTRPSTPEGQEPPPISDQVLAIVIDQETGITTDRGLMASPRDLASLGEVHRPG